MVTEYWLVNIMPRKSQRVNHLLLTLHFSLRLMSPFMYLQMDPYTIHMHDYTPVMVHH